MPASAFSPIDTVDAIVREWLADPELTLICGRWSDGGLMELMPEGRATLTQPRYCGDFAGLRDLNLTGQPYDELLTSPMVRGSESFLEARTALR